MIVEYDYTAKEPDELTIKKGDIIKDVVKKQGGWWQGVLKDKKGMFPDNFVRPMDSSSVVMRNKKDVSRIRQCRVIFSYSPDHEDELSLNVGDIIDIIGEEEEGWWRGTLNGKEGVFPSNFVEEIVPQPKPSTREDLNSINHSSSDEKVPKLPHKPAKQFCEVKYPYKAQNDDELTLKEGDIVTLVSKESQDPGWWRGELNGKVGVFPDNFVILLPGLDGVKEDKKSPRIVTETGAIKPSSIASQRKSLEVKSPAIDAKPSPEPKPDLSPSSTSVKTPPVPSKKPLVSLKKSPSGSSGSSGIFSEIRRKVGKLADAVDGAASSKSSKASAEKEEGKDDNAFDQVERKQLLTDVRATRVKAPGRRPPSSFHKEEESSIPNGNAEHLLDSTESHHTSESEGEKSRLKDWERGSSSIDNADGEKPKLREWEKHKAPWLEEMKLNQAKRSSTSPGREASALRLTPAEAPAAALPVEEAKTSVGEKEHVESPSKSTSPTDSTASVSHPTTPPFVPLHLKPKTSPQAEAAVRTKTPHSVTAAHRHSTGSPVSAAAGKDAPKEQPVRLQKEPKPLAPSPPKALPFNAIPSNAPAQKQESDPDSPAAITGRQYADLLDRLQRLEQTVEKQAQAIEELRYKLQVETDMRMMLQERVSQDVNV
ncbi:unnamed protein product [Acanthoscelides obtectus]|nr:unnamed protein product [Acanthoscelides obtectus]CAK1659182.1 SH3 domain-containing kinase-binding protein 1 [Acanthoscelides obtectus]